MKESEFDIKSIESMIAHHRSNMSDYQYLRLKIEQKRNWLLKIIADKMEGLSEYDVDVDKM
ncbi:hypothetical protein ES703_72465 [subsurface metagenome]